MTGYGTFRWMWSSHHLLISWISFPPHHEQSLNAFSLFPGWALPPLCSAALHPGKRFVILWIPCKPYSSIWAVFQLHESYMLFSFLLKYLRSKKDLCHSGSKSLIKSFIQRPACWRKVRENKLSHRVLFKLSDPFQHALPASLFVCVWGLGWGGREGGGKNSWWQKAHGTTGTFPKQPPPGPQPAFVGTGVCQSVLHTHTHTHTAQNKQQNDFPTTLLTSATLPRVWHLELSPHPRLSGLCLPTSWTGSSV